MVIGGFHLTQRTPQPGSRPGLYAVKQLWDGRMIAHHFPAPVHRGAFAEILSMPEDTGEVELSLHYAAPSVDPPDALDLFYCEGSRQTVRLGPQSDHPFSIFVPFELHLEFPEEGVIYAWLAVDGRLVGHSCRPIVVARG
jgi:hypothetical protein